MKTLATSAKGSKGHGVTLKSARSAATAVRGNRPAGRFLVSEASKTKSVHERFLGEIVHGAKPAATRKGAKKK